MHGYRHSPSFHSGVGGYCLPAELPQLSGLLHLGLYACDVHPSVLSCFTQLQLLHLKNCKLVRCSYDDYFERDEYAREGTEALLDVLPSLTCLQDLVLRTLDSYTLSNTPLQRFSALTASSHLTRLALTQGSDSHIPRGAVQHMFPPDRQMQSLRHLSISQAWANPGWCISSADLQKISQCCQHLAPPGCQWQG